MYGILPLQQSRKVMLSVNQTPDHGNEPLYQPLYLNGPLTGWSLNYSGFRVDGTHLKMSFTWGFI